MADRWYYMQNKQKLGPVTQEEIRSRLATGCLHPTDMIWQEGTPKWVPAGSVGKPSQADSSHSSVQTSLPEGKRARFGGQLAHIGRRISGEVTKTAKATWFASAQFTKSVNGVLRQRRLDRAVTSTHLELGQRFCEIGVGDEQVRSQVAALDEKLRIIKDSRGSARTVEAERNQLLLRLATAALAQKQLPPGAEKQYEAASSANLRLQQHQRHQSAASRQGQSWCRAFVGYSAIACLVVVSLAVARNFVANDSSGPQGEVGSGVPITQAPPTKADDELPKKAESPEKKSPEKTMPEKSPPVSNSPEVTSEGLGTTPDAALKDAFRNAVRQVVGAVVDAETLVKNDEVVSDKILTYSDGFIKTYDEISKEQKKDLFWIKIKALVERRSVIAKLKAANIAVKDIDGKGIFAEVVTQQEAIKSAKELLERAFDGFTGGWIKADVAGKPEIIDKNDTNVRIRVTFHFEPAMDEFNVFANRLRNILDKIAIKSGEFQLVASSDTKKSRYVWKGFADGNRVFYFPEVRRGRDLISLGLYNSLPGRKDLEDRRQFVVALNSQVSNNRDRSDWKYFVLDSSLRPMLNQACLTSLSAKLILEGTSGQVILTDTLEHTLRSRQVTGNFPPYRKDLTSTLFVVAPLFFANLGSYQEKRTFSRDISLALAEIKDVQRIRCVLTQLAK